MSGMVVELMAMFIFLLAFLLTFQNVYREHECRNLQKNAEVILKASLGWESINGIKRMT